MQDLNGQEPPAILSARQGNLREPLNQEKSQNFRNNVTLNAKEIEKSEANTRNPQPSIPRPNAQTAGIASKTNTSSKVDLQERTQVGGEPTQLPRNGQAATTLAQGKGTTNSAVSLLQLSRAALQSSQGRLNEADLISSPPASQGDYLADQSSRATRAEKVPSEKTLGYQNLTSPPKGGRIVEAAAVES